ncbi:PREDICTED: saccharopine dehydrogenase-like oxidoreductase [Nicrophorus vespilloides]|uniref:Saccharopine dehydrogenase-like oxidoreductase n=1 Tax=Nicrophorus vespilloides TaxID=110193 RepID=A0ABM1MMP5_NICVS|nr:PREDICTED: saccharopine dehydrogenase-like oxidoreductase [Nicrophorus vespilloides]
MASKLDMILFGATGFTGKNALKTLKKLAEENGGLTWGVAGRSEQKLKDVLEEMGKLSDNDFSDVPIIIADVKDEESIKQMTAKCRIVLNACGPYRFYGEPVIKACIESGTHHVDISGEPQFLEKMQLKYHEEAKEKGVYIVGACGYDSIPCDMGTCFVSEKFKGTLHSVETYMEGGEEGGPWPGPTINYGTWESAVYGLAHGDELKDLRSKLYATKLPKFKPSLKSRGVIHKNDFNDKWSLPFMGSDRSVVRRSQRYFYEHEKKRPVQINTYFCVDSILTVVGMAILGLVFSVLCKFELGRKWLLDYPHIFSFGHVTKGGPTYEKVEHTLFSITILGQGWDETLAEADDQFTTRPDKKIKARISGRNPGYYATNVMLILSGIMILNEPTKLPSNGGVYPPAAAFARTSMIEKLVENDIKFEVL